MRPSHAAPVVVGEVMVGGAVSRVEASQHPDFKPGELVLGYTGWQDYAFSDGTALTRLDAAMAQPSMALGVLACPASPPAHGLLRHRPAQGRRHRGGCCGERRGGFWWSARSPNKGLSRGRRCRRRRKVPLRGGGTRLDACVDHRSANFAQQPPQPAQAASMYRERRRRCVRCGAAVAATSARGCRCAARSRTTMPPDCPAA